MQKECIKIRNQMEKSGQGLTGKELEEYKNKWGASLMTYLPVVLFLIIHRKNA